MTAPIRLYMSMSLDGDVAGPDDRPGQELGRGGGRLFNPPGSARFVTDVEDCAREARGPA